MKIGVDLISVIIPVYNVEPYLDQCILSVVGQTYENLEIIIIYDESNDNSIDICRKWENKDSRIKLIINTHRGGLGFARNIGLDAATGKYVTFIDSDDWMTEDFIKSMYFEIIASNADFVSDCGYWEVSEQGEACRWSVPPGTYSSNEMKELLINGDRVTMWKKLFKREWLISNQLYQPAIFYYEDWGTFPAMVRMANSIRVAPVAGIKYRIRENSLSNDNCIKIIQAYADSMRHLLLYLSRNNLLKKDDYAIMCYCYRDYVTRFTQYNYNKNAVQALENLKATLLEKWFSNCQFPLKKCYVLGGFQLRWEYQTTNICIEYRHFCFSSLIAMMSDGMDINIKHENTFRQQALTDDNTGVLRKLIDDLNENDVILLDFMEERYDIVKWNDSCYSTYSDAFCESNLINADYIKIPYGSPEFWELWKKSCCMFINMIKKRLPGKQIILVKNRMSQYYGDFDKCSTFSDIDNIKNINYNIDKMEQYILSQCQEIAVIEPQGKNMFAAPCGLFNAEPQYTNNACYAQVGGEVISYLRSLEL